MSEPTSDREYPPGRGPRRKGPAALWSLIGIGCIAGGLVFSVLGNGGVITEQAKTFAGKNAASGNDNDGTGSGGENAAPLAPPPTQAPIKPDLSVALGMSGPGSVSSTITNLAAGDTKQIWLDVTNTTTAPVDGIQFQTQVATPTPLSGAMQLSIDTCEMTPMRITEGNYACSNNAGVGSILDLSAGTLKIPGTLAPQESRHLLLSFRVSDSSDNSVAGSAAEVTYLVNSATIG